jgi:hypothetical protein
MNLWSTAFLENLGPNNLNCFVEEAEWTRLIDQYKSTRLFAQISYGDSVWFAALGSPVRCDTLPNGTSRLFLPYWMLDQLGATGAGEEVFVEWLDPEAFPSAEKITIRPHDSAFYHTDAREELERTLTTLGVLKAGTTLVLPLDALGGYEVAFDIVKTEPANLVLADGDEVAIDFEEALDAVAAAAVPLQPRPPTPVPEDFAALLEPPPAVVPQGQRLGGGDVRRMPDGRPWNPWR